MGFLGQQVGVAVVVSALMLTASAGLLGCEGAPARSKPWRNAKTAAEPEPSAAIQAIQQSEMRASADRDDHVELRVGVGTLPKVPLVAGAKPGALFPAVFEPLVPDLATAAANANATALTVEMRPAVAHDGAAITTADARRSIELARRGLLKAELRDVLGIDFAGSGRIRIRMRRPNGYVARLLESVPVVRGERFGTGPLKLVAADGSASGTSLDLAFADASREGLAARILTVADPAAAVASVQLGELDVAFDRRKNQSKVAGVKRVALAKPRFHYLAFNARRSLFVDPEVRRAASRIIDRSAIASDGYRGRGIARQWPVWPGGPLDSSALPVSAPDRAAASELLDRAGWTRGADGTRERDQQKLIAIAVTANANEPSVALTFNQLRTAGFVLDVRELDPSELDLALKEGRFDLAVLRWQGAGDWDLSPLLETGGAHNVSGINSSVLDAALTALRKAPSREARRAQIPALISALNDVVPIACLVQIQDFLIVGESVIGADTVGERLDLRSLTRK